MRSKIWTIYNLSAACAILFLFLTSFSEAQAAVRINEIVASNSKSLTDQKGNAEDWIELFNNSDEAIDLGGCYLTDKKTLPTQWQFPSPTLLEPYSFLIVFADSSTELPVSGSELHANFNLSKSGEYLGLIDRDGQTPIHEINFPAQYNDISYGIEQSKVNLIVPIPPHGKIQATHISHRLLLSITRQAIRDILTLIILFPPIAILHKIKTTLL